MSEAFEKPWPVKQSTEQSSIAGLPNTVTLTEWGTELGVALVEVPSSLPNLLESVYKIPDLGECSMYLDLVDDHWVFGVSSGNDHFDLWKYTPATLPVWAKEIINNS